MNWRRRISKIVWIWFYLQRDKYEKDLAEGKEVNKLIGHLRGITQIIYDDVSNRIYSSSCDKTINIWDIRMCKKIRSLIGHSSSVYSIAVDQNKLISDSFIIYIIELINSLLQKTEKE